MEDEHRSVIRYEERKDDKGRIISKAIYLKETPTEEIDRLNKMFPAGGK